MSQTQKELLEVVLSELANIKKDLPNGQFKQLMDTVKDLKEDMSEIKYKLLNPENGVIVRTNKNSDIIQDLEKELELYKSKISLIDEVTEWKKTVTKVLWIIFSALVAMIVQVISMSNKVL